jgi:tetratricopeptide (TPR) repeat protein
LQAAKMRPKKADYAFSAGNALRESEEFEEAEKFFEMAVKAEPNNPKYLFALAWIQSVCLSTVSCHLNLLLDPGLSH